MPLNSISSAAVVAPVHKIYHNSSTRTGRLQGVTIAPDVAARVKNDLSDLHERVVGGEHLPEIVELHPDLMAALRSRAFIDRLFRIIESRSAHHSAPVSLAALPIIQAELADAQAAQVELGSLLAKQQQHSSQQQPSSQLSSAHLIPALHQAHSIVSQHVHELKQIVNLLQQLQTLFQQQEQAAKHKADQREINNQINAVKIKLEQHELIKNKEQFAKLLEILLAHHQRHHPRHTGLIASLLKASAP